MAQLTVFGYRAGSSALHGLDVRFKFIAFAVLSLATLSCGPTALAVVSLLPLALGRRIGLSPGGVARELRYFLVFMIFVFAAQAWSAPGADAWYSFSRDGALQGALTVWRLFLIVLFGLLFVATTRPPAIKAAVVWFLRPLPFLSAARIGTMMGLLLRFIPFVFQQAGETMDAQRARGIEFRRNPFYRITRFATPFMRRLFLATDRLAEAMEARCYSESRTATRFSSRRRDWVILVATVGLSGLLALL